ncbi:ATP-binding cassette domain-containing protein [Paenibacillus mesotrionivorans]|uniref:ATP-binding cassette domain-containing protein n=1 Tax=Paenibacillus mesotrionivorans TaxID=3160968 RepID=A0ACC7P407_9BACL
MGKSLIELREVSVYLPGKEEAVLHQISGVIREGEWLTVAGRNGSGKSVLGRLLAGLDGRYSGEIGRSAQGASVRLVMQNPEAQLIGETVGEDLRFGMECAGLPPEEMELRQQEALAATGLTGWEACPAGSLSGGQKQLLALAGALAVRPSVLIADEATSMLDPEARHRLLSVLQSLQKRGMTVIHITQLLEEAAYAGRIWALDEGKLVFDGTPEDFFYSRMAIATGECESPCRAAGLLPPLTVAITEQLKLRGLLTDRFPLTPVALERAVLA